MATKKYINLLQFHQPLMQSGDYQITVEQSLEVVSKNVDESFAPTQKRFSVFGERYFLEPSSVHSIYPPAGSQGEHSNTFPHLILNRSTLPWERSADGKKGVWLALLLFEEKEAPKIKTVTLGEYKNAIAATSETGDGPDEQPVQIIDVPLALAEKIVPKREDLFYMAHTRRETSNSELGKIQVIGPERAVLIGNRLPKSNSLSTVHLVSLENRFHDEGEFDFSKLNNGNVQFLSLKSWSFSSISPKYSLFGMLEHLDRSPSTLSQPFLNGQTLHLRLDLEQFNEGEHKKLLHDQSDYRLRAEAFGSVWTNDEIDQFRQFSGSDFIEVQLPDTAIDADFDAQLDPFPNPTAFSIALDIRILPDRVTERRPIMGAEVKVESGDGQETTFFKPSLWHLPQNRGLAYQVSSVEGEVFEGEIPGVFQNEFVRLVWVKKDSTFQFFTNGYLIATRDAPGHIFTHDSPYYVGSHQKKFGDEETPVQHFVGHLRQLNIFRRPLNEKEAKLIFTSSGYSAAMATNFRLGKGMLALPHLFRNGKKGVSWYRGPLSNRNTNPGFQLPAVAADQLLVFDETLGMFDASYAAAWQLGRLMALEDRQFSLDLFKWKKQMSIKQKRVGQKTHLFNYKKEVAGVTVYSEPGLKGMQKTLRENWTILHWQEEWNDTISSISVPVGWEVTIFQHAHYQGNSKVITGEWEASEDAGWDNQISSIRIDSPLEKRIRKWMKNLHLLHHVPFQYLVPEDNMLPIESVRFFNLDPLWIQSLKDGAGSIGRTTSADFELDKKENLANDPVPQMSGFLLRSELVAGYPGLQILGYDTVLGDQSNPNEDTALHIVRMERLSDQVLLCIFEGDVRTVDFFQKPDVLHFGLDSDGENFAKQLRLSNGASLNENLSNGAPNPHAGINFNDQVFRHRNEKVMNFDQLASSLKAALLSLPADQLGDTDINEFQQFTSADFAMEMMEGAERVRLVRA